MKVHIEGYTTLTGTPAAILKLIQDARLFDETSGDDIIEDITQKAWRFFGIGLQVTGDTYAERAESLLREMDKAHMVTIEEE